MMRVLDLSSGVAGPFSSLLLAEAGADVITVRPPGEPAAVDPAQYAYLHRRKRSVTLDVRRRAGRELFLRLAAGADAVVESGAPGELRRLRLTHRTLRRANPNLVLASITPFGLSGPRRDWQGSELVWQAMGGVMQATGFDGEPPLKLGGDIAQAIAGVNAATALLAAVYGVRTGRERAVHLDIAIQETLPPHWARHISQYTYSGTGMRRESREVGRQGFPHTMMAADGWVYLLALRAEWEAFACFLGLDQFLTPEWSDAGTRMQRWGEIEPAFEAAIAGKSRYQWFADAAQQGYTFAPIHTAADLTGSPQQAARGFFQPAAIGEHEVPCAGLPFHSAVPPHRPNAAPYPGQHGEEVLGQVAGAAELAALRKAGVI